MLRRDRSLVNEREGPMRQTALMLVIKEREYESEEVVMLLLEMGADPNAANELGRLFCFTA